MRTEGIGMAAIRVTGMAGPDVTIETAQQVGALIQQLRSASEDGGEMAMIYLADGPPNPAMSIGVHKDVGWVSYGNLDPDIAVISKGRDTDGEVFYYLEGTHTHEIPASAEIPVETVEAAVTEFLRAGGQQPTAVAWQPYDD